MKVEFPTEHIVTSEKGRKWGFEQQWKNFAIPLSIFLVVSLFFFAQNTRQSRRFDDFFRASFEYGKIKGGEKVPLQNIEGLLLNYPELKPLFSHYLQQSLLLKGDVDRARREALEAGSRLLDLDPLYHNYTEASFLIEEGKLEEALQESLLIKEKLGDGKEEAFSSLYLFNLIRIGYLNKCLGRGDLANEFYALAKKFLEENPKNETVKEMTSHLSDERTTLFDFLSL